MRREEQEIQKAVIAHIKQRGVTGLVYWHTPNGVRGGGRKHRVQGGIAKGMGARAGVSDLVFLHKGKFFALELKAPKGTATDEQIGFISDVNAAGGWAVLAEGLDPALSMLERWGLLRGVAS